MSGEGDGNDRMVVRLEHGLALYMTVDVEMTISHHNGDNHSTLAQYTLGEEELFYEDCQSESQLQRSAFG